MKPAQIAIFCLLCGGVAAWKCGADKKAEEAAKLPAATGLQETAPADINPNQPADLSVPAGMGGGPAGSDPGIPVDQGAGMGDAPSPTDEVPVGTEGAEPGMDYTGDQDVGGVPAQAPAQPGDPK